MGQGSTTEGCQPYVLSKIKRLGSKASFSNLALFVTLSVTTKAGWGETSLYYQKRVVHSSKVKLGDCIWLLQVKKFIINFV